MKCFSTCQGNSYLLYLVYFFFAVEISFKETACAVIADIGLDIIVVPCLVLVIVFWALFGAFVGHPDSESYIVATFSLTLLLIK